jgi:ferritin
MISKSMAAAINAQINREFFSAYLYWAMSVDAAHKGFKGAANWFAVQFKEEQGHALRFAKYLQDQNAKVELAAIAGPRTSWKDLLDMFKDTLAHERSVTAAISDLMAQAVAEKDFATQLALQWFVNEQVEEEASATEVVWMLEMAEQSRGALFMVDKTLGKRGQS